MSINKKIISSLLVLALVLILTPAMRTYAADAQIGNDSQLMQALEDSSINKITLVAGSARLSRDVLISRDLVISGDGNTLSGTSSGYAITVAQGATLTLENISLANYSRALVNSSGTVRLSGTVNISGEYGIMLLEGGRIEGKDATLTALEDCVCALSINSGVTQCTVDNLSLRSERSTGLLIDIAQASGKVLFTGSNNLHTTLGRGISCTGGIAQTVTVGGGALLSVNAPSQGSSFGTAAVEIGECALVIEPAGAMEVIGYSSAVNCDSITLGEKAVLGAENLVSVQTNSLGTITVQGVYSQTNAVNIGTGATMRLGGYAGIVVLNKNMLMLEGSTLALGLSSSGSGDGVHIAQGGFTAGAKCEIIGVAPGRAIYANGRVEFGTEVTAAVGDAVSLCGGGIYAQGDVLIGDNSSVKVSNAKSDCTAVSAQGMLTLGNAVTLESSGVDCAVNAKSFSSGAGCVLSISGAGKCAVWSQGKVSIGEENFVSIAADGSAIDAGEYVEILAGANVSLTGGANSPAVRARGSAQNGFVISGAAVSVSSGVSAGAQYNGAVHLSGGLVLKDSSRLTVKSPNAFGIVCGLGTLDVSSNSTLTCTAACAVSTDGDIAISGESSLYALATVDSALRLSNAANLNVGRGCTIIAQGERFGAELLGGGSINIDGAKHYDFRSTQSLAIYIENGRFSLSNVERLSAWYIKQGIANEDSWWIGAQDINFWERHEKIPAESLGCADYSMLGITSAYQSYKDGNPSTVSGIEDNISTWRCYAASRLSMYLTRPIGQSNVYYIPAGKSFSWMLYGECVQGEGEVFSLSARLGAGRFELEENGKFTYTAPLDARGMQDFEFIITGPDGAQSEPIKISINVTKSKPPLAYSQSFDAHPNDEFTGRLTVEDPDGTIAGIEVTSQPQYGTLVVASDGQFKYSPMGGVRAADSFTYVAIDNSGDRSNEATCTILLDMAERTSAFNSTYVSARDEVVSGKFDTRMADTTKFDHVEITEYPTYGTLEVDGENFTYTPYQDFAGSDTIRFVAVNSQGTVTDEAVITIITQPSSKPSSYPYKLECIASRSFTARLEAQDLDGEIARYVIDVQPQHGTLELDSASGEFTYTPERGYLGTDSFTYYVFDNEGLESSRSQVDIEVKSLADSLRDSGELTRIIMLSIGAVFVVAVIVGFAISSTVRKRRREDMEYRRALSEYEHDMYDDELKNM